MADAKPIATFTREHPDTGKPQTRDAYTPDEVVNLTADGWVEKTSKASTSNTSGAADKPAGGKPNNS
ncbi:hypothetical protein ABZY58_11780 [Micromonospora tulbaghiae]|uniref:hypothetical protein n=1 Tax=Micromonospora tulbaghiae TaxID=479978 RepID=UPI0033B6ABD0